MEVAQDHWPVDDDDRKATVRALMKLIASDDGPVALRSVRLLLKMEELNLRHEAEESRKLNMQLRKLLETKGGSQ